ncbi:MAG: zinc resistance sensor/chaperone ZraP [Klebsiella variicola]|nr:zinc resistance sensor/chaperone ZraP [Klebsiella variicola]
MTNSTIAPVSSQLRASAVACREKGLIFIGESLSSLFRFLQDPSAEIMPFSHAVNPVLKHIACGLASKNDPPDPPGTGHFYQGYSQLTQEQQATAQKLHNDYAAQTSALRQQLQSKRYEYNALLTTQKPDSGKIEAVAQEMEGLRQKLDQQRVKFDVALAEAGVPRGAGMGYNGCRGNGGGHRGMNHW